MKNNLKKEYTETEDVIKLLYSMEMHDVEKFLTKMGNLFVTKVPGGWIYDIPANNNRVNSIFIPYVKRE